MSIREEMEDMRHSSDTGIPADLRWLAENVSDWKDDCYKFIGALGFMVDWQFNCPHNIHTYYTRTQWQAARDELNLTIKWQPEQDSRAKVHPDTHNEDPFSSPEEDEAWQAAEKRMDAIGHNGGTGEHYPAPEYDPQDVAFPQPGYPGRPASKYHVQIKGQWVDVYDILAAYNVTNPADAHAIKKMLCPGQRGVKGGIQDRQEAIVSLQRAIELEGGS